jgi:4-hydroxybenzoate polyprenyltransferase
MKSISEYVKLLRPKQYIKNLFAFTVVLYSNEFFEPETWLQALSAFVALCLVASLIYVFNDIIDAEKDRLHPTKKERPIAKGTISKRSGIILCILIVIVLSIFLYVLKSNLYIPIVFYFVLNVIYTYILKHIFLVDVFALALGFTLRIIAGAMATGEEITFWVYICAYVLALFLLISYRRKDAVVLGNDASSHRSILHKYEMGFIQNAINILSSVFIISYTLGVYSATEDHILIVTLPFVIFGILRFQYAVNKNEFKLSSEEMILSDKPFIINIILWGITFIFALNFHEMFG